MIIFRFFRAGIRNLLLFLRLLVRRRQLRHKRTKLQNQQQAEYAHLGTNIYKSNGQIESQDTEPSKIRISELENQINSIDASLQSLIASHPYQSLTSTTWKYCAPGQESRTCKKCKTVLPVSARFCVRCGTQH